MKKVGGVLHGEWEIENLESGEVRRRCPSIAWGSVTDDVFVHENNTKGGPVRFLQFRIRLKRKEFIRCTFYNDNPFYWAARGLRKGDFVFVAGKLCAWSYTNKDNEHKIAIDIYPQFILTQEIISRMADIQLDPDPILGDDAGEDEDGEISWNPF